MFTAATEKYLPRARCVPGIIQSKSWSTRSDTAPAATPSARRRHDSTLDRVVLVYGHGALMRCRIEVRVF